jgi:hypothetical protein
MIRVVNTTTDIAVDIINIIGHFDFLALAEDIECLPVTQHDVSREGAVTVRGDKVLFINSVWHCSVSFLGSHNWDEGSIASRSVLSSHFPYLIINVTKLYMVIDMMTNAAAIMRSHAKLMTVAVDTAGDVFFLRIR